MRNSKNLMAGFVSFLFVMASYANDVPTIGDLARIQAETVLIKARAKQEEARNELAARRSAGGTEDGTLPVVKSILGTDRRVVATLIYAGNVQVEAMPGDTVPGGYKVGKIHQDSNKVELMKGKQRYTVGFSTVVPTAKQQGSTALNGPIGAPPSFVPGLVK